MGQMAELLEADYDTLALEIDDSESRQRALTSDLAPPARPGTCAPASPPAARLPAATCSPLRRHRRSIRLPVQAATLPAGTPGGERGTGNATSACRDTSCRRRRPPSACSPSSGWSRTSWATKCPISRPMRCARSRCRPAGSIPSRMSGTSKPGLDVPDRLRCISRSSREIAEEAAVADQVEASDGGIGFVCVAPAVTQAKAFAGVRACGADPAACAERRIGTRTGLDRARLADDLARAAAWQRRLATRLSDAWLVKLFRLLRLARRCWIWKRRARATMIPERSGGPMSAPHPLNQAVIAQALHDLRNGQLRRCKAMGFGEEELDALKHPNS